MLNPNIIKTDNLTGSVENKDAELLDKINSLLAELGSSAKWVELPDFNPEYSSLQGKSITIVEDSVDILKNQLPDLVVASNGKASFVLNKDEPIGELVKKIVDKNPDIVLMDGTLANVKGTYVIEMLKKSGYEGKIIGYSSSEDSNDELIASGAIGAVDKSSYEKKTHDPNSVKLLGELIQALEKKEQSQQ